MTKLAKAKTRYDEIRAANWSRKILANSQTEYGERDLALPKYLDHFVSHTRFLARSLFTLHCSLFFERISSDFFTSQLPLKFLHHYCVYYHKYVQYIKITLGSYLELIRVRVFVVLIEKLGVETQRFCFQQLVGLEGKAGKLCFSNHLRTRTL